MIKLEPEKAITERIKLFPQKGKATRIALKILASKKLLPRLSILLAQIKAGNDS